MRYAGETRSAFVSQQAPVTYGRVKFSTESDARLCFAASKALRRLSVPGRIRKCDRLEYLDNLPLQFCYGWVFSKEGLHLAILPTSLAPFFSQTESKGK